MIAPLKQRLRQAVARQADAAVEQQVSFGVRARALLRLWEWNDRAIVRRIRWSVESAFQQHFASGPWWLRDDDLLASGKMFWILVGGPAAQKLAAAASLRGEPSENPSASTKR